LEDPTAGDVKRDDPEVQSDGSRQDGPQHEAPAAMRSAWADYGLNVLPPWNAVFELAALCFVLLVIDWVWPTLDINNLQPSPYWLGVLLLSLQYGTASGSLAAMVAIAAYFAFSTLPEEGVGENEFAYRLRILAQPILWIATAVILGQFRMVQIAAKREMTRRVAELETQGRTLAEYASRLRARCDALERDIVGRREPDDQRLLKALGSLRDSTQPAAPEIAACLAALSPAGTASLYVRTSAGFERMVSAGWPDSAPWLDVLPMAHQLAQALSQGRRSLNVLHAGDDHALAGQGLAAVSVMDAAGVRVIGLLKIETATARGVTTALTEQMHVVAEALAPRIAELGGQACVPLNDASVATARLQPSRLDVVGLGNRVRPKVGW